MDFRRGVADTLLNIEDADSKFPRSGETRVAKVLDGERVGERVVGGQEGY